MVSLPDEHVRRYHGRPVRHRARAERRIRSHLARVSGRINGLQEHVYGFSSTDMVMTADQGLTGLRIDTRRSFRPTRVNMNLVPDEVRRQAAGCSSAATARSRWPRVRSTRRCSGSTPAPGRTSARSPRHPRRELRSRIRAASPGGVGSVAFGRTVRHYHEPCQGRESVAAGSLVWRHELASRGRLWRRAGFLGAQTASSTTTKLVEHFAVALQSAAGMPRPKRSAHGAVAKIGTAETRCSAGVRHSYRIGVRRCQDARLLGRADLRHFVTTRYRGRLSPDDGAPLTALFDTGGFALERGAASLVIRSYIR